MKSTETNDRANRFAIAKGMASNRRNMWVSQKQFDEFKNSGQFTDAELQCFQVVEPWPDQN